MTRIPIDDDNLQDGATTEGAEAGDGAAALALLADQSAAGGRVSLIVLDMMLPGVTGNGVLRQMQTRWPNIPCWR